MLVGNLVAFIHFVLHDNSSRLFIREPVRFISREKIQCLMEENGLAERTWRQTEI